MESSPIARYFDSELPDSFGLDRVNVGRALDDVQGVVGSLLDALFAEESGDQSERSDVAWLRPLAILFAELEHSARYRRDNADAALAVCRELAQFMSGVGCPRGFALRYDGVRGRSPTIAMLHLRVLRSCRRVFELGPSSAT